ncbi:MAG: hypothetical protein ACR2JD_07810 [Nocardioides sp.]
MYGDTTVMRKRADQLREQGVDIAMMADRLVSQADGIDWTGRAADAMRARIRDRAAHLREAAGFHDTAADTLGRHLAEVDLLKESIAGIEHRGDSLVADDAGQSLTSFVPPKPGHKDWLTVNLPGL